MTAIVATAQVVLGAAGLWNGEYSIKKDDFEEIKQPYLLSQRLENIIVSNSELKNVMKKYDGRKGYYDSTVEFAEEIVKLQQKRKKIKEE